MELTAAQLEELQQRIGTDSHALIWISARNRTTNLVESLGFWTGDDHQQFSIDGELRTYFGAGAVLELPQIRASMGLTAPVHRIALPPLLDEVRLALRVYDPRNAPIEVHIQPFSIATGVALDTPQRVLKGRLDMAPETLDKSGSQFELQIVSTAAALGRGHPLKRTNAALQILNPSDRGREYSDVAGEWSVPWGES